MVLNPGSSSVREHREAVRPKTGNYGFPPTAASTVTIFNDGFTSTSVVRSRSTATAEAGRPPRHAANFRSPATHVSLTLMSAIASGLTL